ncbi:MAG: filamentous hemagglutinin N-terminal domain-containing protein, partial [Polaromonas sp.]|nr:filamentous hemagglutinin N-terminal domain-containing protein [Polaromonas sp.]
MNKHASLNRFYRLVWSDRLAAYVAVAETATGRGKRTVRAGALAATFMAAVGLSGPYALAGPPIPLAPPLPTQLPTQLPTGAQVTAGSAAVTQAGSKMDVNQTSNRAVINWNTFNVGSQAQVNFNQPSATAATLNRVLDSNPSQILGKITANGQVYFVNPNGVYFGKSASVDVGALVASTHNIKDADFMAGNAKFSRDGSTGSVVNEGDIRAALNGFVALLAPEVRNEGVIVAQLGTVALASGEAVSLQFDGEGRLHNVTVEPSQIKALVENKGAVLAPGGLIILSARAVDRLQGGVVKNSGKLEATGMAMRGGKIVLDASDRIENTGSISANAAVDAAGILSPAGSISANAPDIVNSGSITASGLAANAMQLIAAYEHSAGAGGTIGINSAHFTQTATGQLDASGSAGGSIAVSAGQDIHAGGGIQAQGGDADGGSITLVASGNLTLSSALVDASGASSGGRIHVEAGNSANPRKPTDPPLPEDRRPTLALTGSTQIRSGSSRGRGGAITLGGEQIGLWDNTAIDASGATGGGTVLVGGDWQGKGSSVPNAQAVVMSEGARIDASATQNGSGGKVVLWSQDYTGFYGQISARGGVQGDGGQVETSGHQLDAQGSVDAGGGGLWLLDPYDVTTTSASTGNGTYASHTFTPSANTATVAVSSITASLNAGNSVTINTTGAGTQAGNITVNNDIDTGTSTGTRSLTLNAVGHINLNATIRNSTGTFDLVLNAGGGISGTGNISGTGATTFNVGSSPLGTYSGIISGTRSLTKAGAGLVYLTGANTYTGITTISAGTLQIGGGQLVGTLGSGSVTNNAALIFNRSNALTVSNLISGSGTVEKLGAGTLTLSGANTYDGATTISAGTLVVGHNTALGSTAGGTTVASGATLTLLDVAVGAEAVTLNGATLSNSANTSSPAGNITLSANSTINASGTQITLSG